MCGTPIRFQIMETSFHHQSSSSCSPPSKTSTPVPASPCSACKVLRRRCTAECALAPFFPPTETVKFMIAHRVFGASNIIKLLREIPESQRDDAVTSMVYEATARTRDPVYGCTGSICQLQNQVNELQAELARTKAELINIQTQQASLMAIISSPFTIETSDSPSFIEDHNQSFILDSLWI